MPARKGLLAPQNTFLDTIATRFDGTHSNFVLGNAKITRIYPIVYCSDGFCELTGYSRAQIMQKSCACNFLYGQKTDVQHRDAISKSLERKQELKLEVILYKSSGTPFWCLLDIVPIQDEKHEVVLFLCSHKDITKQKLHEQQQRVALHHQMHLQQAAAAAAAAATADHQPNQQHNFDQSQPDKHATRDNQNRHQLVPICDAEPNDNKQHQVDNQHQPVQSAQEDGLVKDSNSGQQLTLQQQQEHDDQQALISMEEFCIDDMDDDDGDLDGDQDDEHHDKHTANQYSRRRSRAVLYQLSGHYGYRRSVNMKSKLKLNNRMTIPEYKTTTIEKQKFILSHYGLGKSCWDWLILIVSFYVAIVVPYNATFKEKRSRIYFGDDDEALNAGFLANSKNQSTSSVAGQARQSSPYGRRHEDQVCQIDSIDIFVEVVFIIDVLLNFRTTFVNRKGEVVTRPKIICRHYFRGWFIVDACAALPFDLLCGLNLLSRSLSNIDLNLLKLIRLLRLARLLQKMDRYSQYSYIILTLLMLIFSLLAHWCACIWYVIAMEEIGRHPPEWKLGWIHQLSDKLGYNVVNATDMASSYVTALYFTTSSLTSVGFGNVSANTNAEKIFSIVIMLIGALMHAVVFGNVTALIRVMYARRSNYQTRLRDLKDFFRLHQLPKDLQQRMSDYFQTTWSLNHGIETYEILKDFPEELRGDVSLHLHREVLSLPIFASAPQGFLKSLARHIESKFCCPTEYLIHRGDALGYLYLVCNGSMEVLQDNMVVGILGKGDLVGYDVNASLSSDQQASGQFGGGGGCGGGGGVGVSTGAGSANQVNKIGQSMGSSLVKSSSDLKALTYCDLKCIHIGGLLDVLKLYPEFADTFHDEIIHDLSFNLREQHEEHDEDVLDDEEEDDDDDEEEEDDEDDGDVDDGDDDDNEDERGDSGEGADSGRRNDDEKDDGGDEARGASLSTSPPPPGHGQQPRPQSPPGASAANNQMGRLLRSITENGRDQADSEQSEHIGRYDYEDDELVNGAIAVDDGGDDEQDDEEDDDDDSQVADNGQAPALNGRNNNDSSDDDGANNSSRANNPGRSSNRPKTGNAGDWQASSDGRRGSKQLSTSDSNNGGQRRQQRMIKRAIESASLENYSNCATEQLDSLDQDEEAADEELDQYDAASLLNVDLSTPPNKRFGRGAESGAMASFGTKLARRVRDDDWQHFSHSYDGLVVSTSGHHQTARRTGSQGTQQQQQQQQQQQHREQHLVLGSSFGGQGYVKANNGSGLLKSKGKNKSDETVLELAQLKRTTTAPVVGGGTNPTRLKSAIGAQGQSRASKPPISFDLSRNTTAIIDRRRRSAGCIQRLNLISATAGSNQVGVVRMAAGRVLSEQPSKNICEGKRCHSSSLININENEPMTIRDRQMVRNQQLDTNNSTTTGHPNQKSRRRSLDKVTLVQQPVDLSASGPSSIGRQAASKSAFKSSYSNQDLQQIDAHITASVKKLRQEFKQELNKAIESLARLMLERDTVTNISLGGIVDDRTSIITSKQVTNNKRNKQQQQQSTMSELLSQALDKPASSPRVPLRVAQSSQLQRRETATELLMDRQEPKVDGVCRSISSNSFNGRPTPTNSDQIHHQINNYPQRQAIVTIKHQQPKQWPLSLTSGTSSGSSSSSSQPVDGLATTTSLALVPADSCPVGLVQPNQNQQQQQHQQIICKKDDNISWPISQSSTIAQEQRPSSDTCRRQQQQDTTSSGHTNGQSVLMLNASDNDSGRSTCSVNSSGVMMAASLARSPISSATRGEPTELLQNSDFQSQKVANQIPAIGGIAAKMLLKTAEQVVLSDLSTFGQDESYTIDIGELPVDIEHSTQ